MTFYPAFYLDADSLPALVFRGAGGSPSYRATLECCDAGGATFALGPRYEDCVVVLCTGASPLVCPKDDTVRFRVAVDCTVPHGPPCASP